MASSFPAIQSMAQQSRYLRELQKQISGSLSWQPVNSEEQSNPILFPQCAACDIHICTYICLHYFLLNRTINPGKRKLCSSHSLSQSQVKMTISSNVCRICEFSLWLPSLLPCMLLGQVSQMGHKIARAGSAGTIKLLLWESRVQIVSSDDPCQMNFALRQIIWILQKLSVSRWRSNQI